MQAAGARLGWHIVPASRYDITRRDYYSPLPDLGAVAESTWTRRSPLRGIRFDVEAQFRWAEEHLAPFARTFAAGYERPAPGQEYYLRNWSYQAGDAEILYAIVRHAKPRRIVELGSGFSTLVMAAAVVANRQEGHTTVLECFNPFAPDHLTDHVIDGLHAQHAVAAQDIALETLLSLQDGDVLFVDTTHTVKIGSEVNRIVLDVMPLLAPGVLVHFHDIMLPYEYPRWLVEKMAAWNEQYLLQAFLIDNQRFEVLVGLHAMARADPQRLAGIAPHYNDRDHFPTSFWIRAK